MNRLKKKKEKPQDPMICCLPETHFSLKDTQTVSEEMDNDTSSKQ